MAQTHEVFIPQIDKSKISKADIKHVTDRIIKEVRPYSVVPDEGIAATVHMTVNIVHDAIAGYLVECGVWRGGVSIAMLLAQQYVFGSIKRPVWMYDSFEGMGEPSPEDGESAKKWSDLSKSGTEDIYNQNWCAASLEEVEDTLRAFNLMSHVVIRKGWYKDTLNLNQEMPNQIALLRMDCDWYDPCMRVLRWLTPRVPIGGIIMLDDYYVWRGCTLATHEYLAENKLAWPIRSVENFHGAWMVRGRNG